MIRQEPYFCQFELCKYIYWPLEQYLSDKIKRTASNADLVKSSKKDIHHDLWSDLRRSWDLFHDQKVKYSEEHSNVQNHTRRAFPYCDSNTTPKIPV